jgi:Na+-translocating ferredoxin:NAD+ oxidoreductase RnfD subunit
MTMAAVLTTFVFSAIYYAATGIFFFSDLHVPIAVFLGMHLLFTDPATSPRTELGRIIYGVLYGLTTVLLYDCCYVPASPASTTSCCRYRCSTCP